MKKVLALVLAVAMVSTVAFAWTAAGSLAGIKYHHTTTASDGVDIDQHTTRNTLKGVSSVIIYGNDLDEGTSLEYNNGTVDTGRPGTRTLYDPTAENPMFDIDDMLFRAVTTDNYTVTNIKVVTGRSLFSNPAVSISNSDEKVSLNFVKDLNNTTSKNFDVTFTLKGKGKMVLKSSEVSRYNDFLGLDGGNAKEVGATVSIPTVRFKLSGSVGYGKVSVDLGDYTDEDLEDLNHQPVILDGGGNPIEKYNVDFENDVINFTSGGDFGAIKRSAGAYTADAVLTEHYGELTMEARVYKGDTLYLFCNNKPDRALLGRLADVDGDVDFYFFEQSSPSHVTLNSNAKLIFEDTEEGDYLYDYRNGKLYPVGEYDEDEGCLVYKTRKLGQYITSGHELVEMEIAGSDDIANPDTGANDVVGIAAALAAVALVSAAAVSLKK